ncbi:MAG: hypothetical protein ACREBD_32145, partial [Blastocatellia bacterium]
MLTPVVNFNRPGLDAIAYRVGAHGSFLETMKARLSGSDFPRLVGLTTRDGDDASIALLDAWATVGDALTFYQERIANEGYLRTATERRSILELARLIGYRLRPGVAASVYLAYTIETTQEQTTIEAGNRAQSIPGPGELPQVFETAERLVAYSNLNVMTPRTTQPQFFDASEIGGNISVYVQGAPGNLLANNGIVLDFKSADLTTPISKFYRVIDLSPEPAFARTLLKLRFSDTPASAGTVSTTLKTEGMASEEIASPALIASFEEAVAEFTDPGKPRITKKSDREIAERVTELLGQAPVDPSLAATMQESLLPQLRLELERATRGSKVAARLNEMITRFEDLLKPAPSGEGEKGNNGPVPPTFIPGTINLLKQFNQLPSIPPANEARLLRDANKIFAIQSRLIGEAFAEINPLVKRYRIEAQKNAPPTSGNTIPRNSPLRRLVGAEVLRTKANLAGHNLPPVVRVAPGTNQQVEVRAVSPPNLRAYVNAMIAAGAPVFDGKENVISIALDGEYPPIKPESRIVVHRPGNEGQIIISHHTVKEVGTYTLRFPTGLGPTISLKVTVIQLETFWLAAGEIGKAETQNSHVVLGTTVYVQGEKIEVADEPIESPLDFTKGNSDLELSAFYPGLEPGRWVMLSGERMIERPDKTLETTGVRVSELLMVASATDEERVLVDGKKVQVEGERLHTFLLFDQAPKFIYKRDTVKLYGNVVRATHGQTQDEVLGSGDGSQKLQSFQLKQSPLTYLAAPTPSGAQSTLEVRVNDVLWHEAGNQFTLGPNDRNYITKAGDDAKVTVVFGNGEHGARLPTGSENIKAVYRFGIGKPGNVNAEQIKLPLTRPLGVKDVINPIPASGGADRET